MRERTSGRPTTFVYEILSEGQKIGICVATDIETATLAALRAYTRKTDSKIDLDCDYPDLLVRMLDSSESEALTLQTAFAAERRCVPFGSVDIPNVGVLSFEAARYPYVGAPLALTAWVQCKEEPNEPYADITKAYPRGADEKVCVDEVLVKTYPNCRKASAFRPGI
jgi:hypothetical protein